MKEKKWTPGPWYIAPREATYSVVGEAGHRLEKAGLPTEVSMISVGTRNGQVAAIPMDESSVQNANLISAAPDLVEVLESILYYDERGQGVGYVEALERGRAALAKAYGETNHD